MANIAQPCQCSPYENLCCGTCKGISVIQPECQNLPDGSVVNNPAFVPNLNRSFWTYKFLTDCNYCTKPIHAFVIPICDLITDRHIIVSEKIDGCGKFQSVPFSLIQKDSKFHPAPQGFQFLKVETNNRYKKGVSVEYRIEILGDYPVAIQPIQVKTKCWYIKYYCERCFLVPGCHDHGNLTIDKKCSHKIVNNQATLFYNIDVSNIGKTVLENVQFNDIINIPTQLEIGTIEISPPLNVDTSTPGQIIIRGNLGTIESGGNITITYQINIATVTSPGKYFIHNTANVVASETESSASCSTVINAIKLKGDKTCSINGQTGVYTLMFFSEGASPDALVDILDHMLIPTGVTISVQSFNNCEAFFSGTTMPVPLNTDITGPIDFDIICNNQLIPAGDGILKRIIFTIVSCSVIGTSTISSTITKIAPANPQEQIFLQVSNIPISSQLDINLTQQCP